MAQGSKPLTGRAMKRVEILIMFALLFLIFFFSVRILEYLHLSLGMILLFNQALISRLHSMNCCVWHHQSIKTAHSLCLIACECFWFFTKTVHRWESKVFQQHVLLAFYSSTSGSQRLGLLFSFPSLALHLCQQCGFRLTVHIDCSTNISALIPYLPFTQ